MISITFHPGTCQHVAHFVRFIFAIVLSFPVSFLYAQSLANFEILKEKVLDLENHFSHLRHKGILSL